MTRHRTPKPKLALLLAMILPLQGFAAAWSCPAPSAAEAARHHCDDGTGAADHQTGAADHQTGAADHQTGTTLHHSCGTCCSAAVAVMSASWVAPRSTSPYLSLPSSWSLPAVALDRLDRPPRFIPA